MLSMWDKGKEVSMGNLESIDATPIFLALSSGPAEITDDNVAVLERFTILLYDRTSDLTNIDEARKELFTKKSRAMDAIPPTRGALVQHIKREVYQGNTAGAKQLQLFKSCHPLLTGGGLNHPAGNCCGPLCQKPVRPRGN